MEISGIERKARKRPVPARLFVIFARSSSTAVIFRRGPSKWVQLVKWNTKTDTFEPGQWFHGRIYERRCDLSPDGSLLIYFAQRISAKSLKDAEYTYAWTAISRPPFFTALALWPKGDCWHGGGSFPKRGVVLLNHKPDVAKPHKDHKPRKLRVIPNPKARGEDDPIFSDRLERDGWLLKQEWKFKNRGYPEMYHTIQPEIRERVGPNRTFAIKLERSLERLVYSEEFTLVNLKTSEVTKLQKAGWVDWDQQGRLVAARAGKVFAVSITKSGELNEELLIDLNPSKPEPLAPPKWATKW